MVFLLQLNKMSNRPLNILLADDDSEDLELIESAILKIDIKTEVHSLTNGKAVVDYLGDLSNTELPCLIILDYNMPELTGLDVLLIINKEKRYDHIPKIILSTSNATTHKFDCIINGAIEYFVKPNNMQDLDNLAKKMLDYCRESS